MDDYATRLRDESLDLDHRMRKLTLFIGDDQGVFPTLDSYERALLVIQLDAMRTYATILRARLARARSSLGTDTPVV